MRVPGEMILMFRCHHKYHMDWFGIEYVLLSRAHVLNTNLMCLNRDLLEKIKMCA
jgi:hypothetical protein